MFEKINKNDKDAESNYLHNVRDMLKFAKENF